MLPTRFRINTGVILFKLPSGVLQGTLHDQLYQSDRLLFPD